MSALCLRVGWRLLTIIYICISTTLCSKVIWKSTGESITIQCRYESEEALSVFLKKGLKQSQDFFYISKKGLKENYADPTRSQMHNRGYPNFDIIFRNLTVNDTGVYWCMYQELNTESKTGKGSVLLVVKDPVIVEVNMSTAAGQSCNQPNQNLVMISVIISAVVLFAVFIFLLLFVIRKGKYLRVENKPSPAPHNDVYEDMRGTIRR